MNYTLQEIMDSIETWLIKGYLNPAILADNFRFISPFWKSNDKNAFLDKFLDTTEYKEKSLSKILRFDPVIKLKSDEHKHFSIILEYHTKYNVSVDEAVLGTVENGLLVELRSIYDLAKTRQALQVED